METGFPLVMLIGPLVAAALALATGRFYRAGVAIGLVSLGLLTLLISLAAPGTGLFGDNTAGLFGRSLALTPLVRSLFLFIYPATGALFLFAWFRPMGRVLVPTGLAVLAPLAGALMVSPIGLGAVLLVMAAAVLVPLLHDGHFEAAGATWRYFLMMTVGAALLMLTATGQLGGYSLSWFAPLLATIMLLGGFPLHIWIDGLCRRISPAAAVIVFGLTQFAVVTLLLVLLDSAPAARASTEFQSAVRWSAVLTTLVAAFEISRATTWRGIAAGAILLDMGFLLPATLAPGAGGLVIALPALMGRYFALVLITLGLGRRVEMGSSSRGERLTDSLGRALLIYGCLSLVGLPLTPGFAGRWAQLNVVGQGSGSLGIVLLVASMAIGAVVVWRAVLRRPDMDEYPPPLPAASGTETVLAAIFLALAVMTGLFPDLLPGIAAWMIGLA